jgi:[ribosomal protein S5]-alanine N-acetyltransferase
MSEPAPERTAAPVFPAAEGRVLIRPFAPGDAAEFTAAARASTALHRPWLFPPTTAEQYAAYAGRLTGAADRAGFLVCETGGATGTGDGTTADGAGPAARPVREGRIAGFVNINNIVRGAFRCGSLGYGAFAHAAGRGLMSEGLRLVLDHAFGPMGLHRLEADIQPGNTASAALVRGAGFRLEGYSPDFLFIDGAWRDHERWALTAGPPQPAAR